MAYTPDVLNELRRLINDTVEPYVYSTEVLAQYLDDADGNIRVAAARIWREKASKYVELVDVQEGSSRRALGQMMQHALDMADGLDEEPPEADGGYTTTRAIERV